MVDATRNLEGLFLYDFPELYDPLTRRIEAHLSQLHRPQIREIYVSRSKDREDPTNRRNFKRMVSIQYQESVHCIAFALHLLGKVRGGLASAMNGGLSVRGEAEPYRPPNPAEYPYVVDGRCRFSMSIGPTKITGDTNFKSGAKWTKRRRVSGTADGRPFSIDAEYLEGHKRCVIDGVDQQCDPADDSYRQVLLQAGAWKRSVPGGILREGMFPNPRFARMTYQLSSVLWRSCFDNAVVRLRSIEDLSRFDAGFHEELASMRRYPI